jgi:acetyl-CoA carboxylase biotin carboxyl carrier protein
MNQKELKELIEFLKEKGIAEFELERGDVKVKVRWAAPPAATAVSDPHYIPVATTPAMHPPPPVPPPARVEEASAAPAAPAEQLHSVRSPIVGTFYEAPSPGAPPFVKAGDQVEVGQVLCIVEAMKLMNEIECDIAGEIVKKLATNGQPIEYGQELFFIRPKK